MSTSKAEQRSRRKTGAAVEPAHFPLPPTVSHAALLEKGTDKRFRQLVHDLFTLAARMSAVREHLARGMDLTGPQYTILMAIAQMQGSDGVAVGALARSLHVSSAFIATETGKLAKSKLVDKRPNPDDRRGVLLRITAHAGALIESNSEDVRRMNDTFFAGLSRSEFIGLSRVCAALVRSSQGVMVNLKVAAEMAAFREAAE